MITEPPPPLLISGIYALMNPVTNLPLMVSASRDIHLRFDQDCSAIRHGTFNPRMIEWSLKYGILPSLRILHECQKWEFQELKRAWIYAFELRGVNLLNYRLKGGDMTKITRRIRRSVLRDILTGPE